MPIVFNQHDIGTMDDRDPAVTDVRARGRKVNLFNNAGLAKDASIEDTRPKTSMRRSL